EVKTLGWRKTGVIARVLDATNYTYWINEARQESLPVLEEKVKAAKGGNEESETPIKMSLQFTEEENSIIETALEHAMQGD
ncbi:hypothetical protein, partial [Escherichia coli]|uniref:hypothetical protein n=1 Tax=Escherichia coli TaxID=562 RepID=UPI0015C47ED1